MTLLSKAGVPSQRGNLNTGPGAGVSRLQGGDGCTHAKERGSERPFKPPLEAALLTPGPGLGGQPPSVVFAARRGEALTTALFRQQRGQRLAAHAVRRVHAACARLRPLQLCGFK